VFTDIAIPYLLHVTLVTYVTLYPSAVSVFSNDSTGLVNIIFFHIGVHRIPLMLQSFIVF